MQTRQPPRPVVLCILDGWGHREARDDNAIALARTPRWDRFMAGCPHALLAASAAGVGLPAGQMGNSEVGHMTIGAGRVVVQDLPRIDAAIADGSLAQNPKLGDFIAALEQSGGAAHLMGLMSPGGVHSHQRHLTELARILAGAGIQVRIHAFLDGRDTPPASARTLMMDFQQDIADLQGVDIATVAGRYFAMDRDRRHDRTRLAWEALVLGQGVAADEPGQAIAASYDAGETDEFMRPAVLTGYTGMADGDGLLMANFRADRARQILGALLDPGFDGFPRQRVVRFAAAAGMVEYSSGLSGLMTSLFPREALAGTLGEAVAGAGRSQLRIAETEKYAHVTFFLNGGEERIFPGEERILLESPKVATYDLKPEMAAPEITDRLVEQIAAGRFDLIVVNYANADMVGHTGDLDAAIRAIETVDASLGRLADAVTAAGGVLLITADHGNAEQMRDPATAGAHTAHSCNPVPLVLAVGAPPGAVLRDGGLAGVAPTLLELMEIAQPPEMTGTPLLTPPEAAIQAEEDRAEHLSA